MTDPAAHAHERRLVLLSGSWKALGSLEQLLAETHGLRLAPALEAGVEVIVHAAGKEDKLAGELEQLRKQSKAPIVVLASEPSPVVFERALAVSNVDVLLVDPGRPALASENVAFAVRNTFLAARSVQSEQSRAKVLTVFSPKGGTGKSVTATNLAAELARDHERRVLLIDLDVQFGDVAIMLGLEPVRTLLDAVSAPGELDEQKLAGFVEKHPSGLHVLAAPDRPEEAELLTEEKVAQLIDVAASVYDAVVVDTSPYFHGPMLSALDRSDELLMVGNPDLPTLKNLRLVLHTLEQISFPAERIRVVLNRSGERTGLGAADLTSALDLQVSFELPYDPAVAESVNRGVPAVLDAEDSPFARAMATMANQLVGDGAVPQRHARGWRLRASLGDVLLPRRKALA